MKLDEAFCLTDNRMYTAEELLKKISSLRGKAKEEYTKFLVCPYCKVPNCEFIHTRRISCFEMDDDQQHRPGCIYNLEEYSQEKIKSDIQKRKITYLESALNLVYNLYQSSPTALPQEEKIANIRRVPQKRIDAPLRGEDFFCHKLYYGFVLVEPHFTETDKYYLLKSKQDGSAICKITITDTTYKFLPIEYKLLSPTQLRFVCFLGYFKRTYTEDAYGNNQYKEDIHTTSLIDSRLLKIEI